MLMVRKIVLSIVAVLTACTFAFAQNKQVSGTVVDAEGNPILGAAVTVVGTTVGGQTTGVSGEFVISAPANGALEVSFIGYKTKQVPIAGKSNIKVVLEVDTQAIDDVVVVAFGQQKKEAFTGSAAVVKADEIAKTQTSNIAQALAGTAPGVQLTNTSGQPGSRPSILVRGIGSLSAGTEPLWVVDGIPYDGDLSLLNPADIESMTVLKDAASTALYGSRGANGVVMVTTKKANVGKANITFDAKWGASTRAVQDYEYINDPAMYYETIYGAIYDYGMGTLNYDANRANQYANTTLMSNLRYQVFDVPEGQHFIGTNGKVNPNATLGNIYTSPTGEQHLLIPDDWKDEAFKTGLRQEYNVNVSAADARTNFYASFGYLSDEGIIDRSSMERYSARLKADYKVKKWLKVGANAGYTNYNSSSVYEEASQGSTSTVNVFGVVTQVAPIYPIYIRDAEGNILKDQNGNTRYDWGSGAYDDGGIAGLSRPVMTGSNAVAQNLLDVNGATEGNSLTANGFIELDFLKDFKFTFNVGTTLDEYRSTSFTNPYYGGYADQNGMIDKSHGRFWAFNMQQILNYSKELGNHTISAMIGHENYKRNTASLYAGASNMFSTDLLELAGAINDGTGSSSKNGYNTEGYFGRLEYNYGGKYYVDASYRRDASSRFHPDNRWGNFWSLGAAWVMTNEDFMSNTSNWLDMLKIKLSYGSQGNDGIGNYLYTDLYNLQSAGGAISTVLASKGNKNITWETNSNLNAGVEISVFNGRLSGDIDFFYRKTSDMLFSRPVAPSLGYSSYMDNIGDMHNTGLEFNITGDIIRTKNVTWSARVSGTTYKNVIDKLPPEKMIDGGYVSGDYWRTEGGSIYDWYMRSYAGTNEQGEALYYKKEMVDVKNEKGETIGQEWNGNLLTTTDFNAADKLEIGKTSIPDLFGGFGTTVTFYGFDFSANFTYAIGGWAFDYGYMRTMSSPSMGGGNNIHVDVLKSWTPDNMSQDYPRYYYNDLYTASYSDRFLTKASYLNLQNLNLGYTIPAQWTKKLSIEGLRIYLSCENVFYWSKRKGFDPRQSFGGMTNDTLYSPLRVISGGINFRF